MKNGTPSIVVIALSLAIAVTSASTTHASTVSPTIVVINQSWEADEAEGRRVLDWVASHSPDRAPIGRNGVVTVERVRKLARAHRSSSETPTPPGGLPEKGSQGEEYNVENTLPDGTSQSWSYRWTEPSTGHGGYWDMVGYSYRKGNDPLDIK
jgi:hypothetical protein